ncbi:MAG: bis(5'-nucleosyl)-tetraphosphatase (symmetrical) YqeK [Oscillospiraceae bacterium]|jgi:predicted HD superfamily hydrolase involved in NAD metabolism|nr:bis(5'-nucleosyl)-tetraphosphatase (symmetrical) YqeK [Oscillospiraceae bacterium]
MNLEKYKKIIKTRLSEERFIHCLNVSKEARNLAEKYGADPKKAEIAGLLHDATKETPQEEQMEFINKLNIKLSDAEINSFKLLHSVSGYAYAILELGIKDKDILNAIRYHTSGRAKMSLLEKAVFVADFISRDRKYKSVKKMRSIAYISLDEAVINGIEYTVTSLFKKRSVLDPKGIEAYNTILLENKVKTFDNN